MVCELHLKKKKKSEESQRKECNVFGFEDGKEIMTQGMQEAGKGKNQIFLLSQRGNQPYPFLDFSLLRPMSNFQPS